VSPPGTAGLRGVCARIPLRRRTEDQLRPAISDEMERQSSGQSDGQAGMVNCGDVGSADRGGHCARFCCSAFGRPQGPRDRADDACGAPASRPSSRAFQGMPVRIGRLLEVVQAQRPKRPRRDEEGTMDIVIGNDAHAGHEREFKDVGL